MFNTDTLLLSDIHLGFGENTAKWLLAILPEYRVKRIIFVGDTFHEHYRFEDLSKDELRFMTWLFNLGSEIEVIMVPGNHDQDLPKALVALSQGNIQIIKKGGYAWEYKGKRFIAIHGHQFDDSFVEHKYRQHFLYLRELQFRRVDRLIDWFLGYRRQLILSQFFQHHYWLERIKDLSDKMMKFARKKKCHGVFCGHVHQSSFFQDVSGCNDDEEIHPIYINLGCWVDKDPTLCIVGPEGELLATVHTAI